MPVKDQVIHDRYALYCGDACEVLPDLPDESVGFSVFSPPFPELYVYSNDMEDMSNCKNYQDFFTHFAFLIRELHRLTMPGRCVAVHCMDLPLYKRNGDEISLQDFPGDIIRAFKAEDFVHHSPRICIWKDPLVAATRTKAIGLAHKQLCKDSSLSRTGIPDQIVVFRKKGENPVPIRHDRGLTEYYGSRPVPTDLDRFLSPNPESLSRIAGDMAEAQKRNKRSHWIWQQYASPVWFDVRQTRVLPYREARGQDDERHICPLQLDTIERCVELWSGKGDTVLSPFAGVGSEVYVAVKNGRKGIGVELKPSYYRQMKRNVRQALREGLTTNGRSE
jgi:DNA modification methylase